MLGEGWGGYLGKSIEGGPTYHNLIIDMRHPTCNFEQKSFRNIFFDFMVFDYFSEIRLIF